MQSGDAACPPPNVSGRHFSLVKRGATYLVQNEYQPSDQRAQSQPLISELARSVLRARVKSDFCVELKVSLLDRHR